MRLLGAETTGTHDISNGSCAARGVGKEGAGVAMVSWARQPSAADRRRARMRAGLSMHGIDSSRFLPTIPTSVRQNASLKRLLTAFKRWGDCDDARAQHEVSWAREASVTQAEKASVRLQHAVSWNMHG